jgi:hypothetical protein
MNDVVTAITTGLTPTVIYGQITTLVPILILLVPIALGLYFLRKLVKGAAKGKVKF